MEEPPTVHSSYLEQGSEGPMDKKTCENTDSIVEACKKEKLTKETYRLHSASFRVLLDRVSGFAIILNRGVATRVL